MLKGFLANCFLLLTAFSTAAQLTVSFPIERTVFQRNNQDKGFIAISGSSATVMDSLQVEFSHLEANRSKVSIFKKLKNQTKFGYFQDRVELESGWFKMTVRAFKSGIIADEKVVNRVGIGEVFLIAGQSNAQGVRTYGAVGAKDDRVNCVDWFNINSQNTPPNQLKFSQVGDNVDIGPNGKTPWCWGELGDMLADKYDVPVMFFNGAWTGSRSRNWFESPQDIPTFDAIFRVNFPIGFPYKNLEISLKYYASLLGSRAILWHQGEGEVSPGIPNYQEYIDYVGFMIRETKKDFGADIPFVMSEVSYVEGRTSELVLNAQRDLIKDPSLNTFQGPVTDNLMIPRMDGVHFGNTNEVKGLTILANAWFEALNDDFFNDATPILTNPFALLESTCTFLQPTFKAPSNNQIYRWNDGSNSSSKTQNTGILGAFVLDSISNYKISNTLNLGAIRFNGPTSIVGSDRQFCIGDSLLVTASPGWENYQWNNGKTGQSIYIKTNTNLSYRSFNVLGCEIGQSARITISQTPIPDFAIDPKFEIESNGKLEPSTNTIRVCEGDTVSIKAIGDWEAFLWNGEEGSESIQFTSNRNVSFKGKYGGKCLTEENEQPFLIRYQDRPLQPKVEQQGIFGLGLANITDFTDPYDIAWYRDGSILENETNPKIGVNEDGNYTIIVSQMNGQLNCASLPSESYVFSTDDFESDYFAYPSPTNGTIKLESKNPIQSVKLMLYDTRGVMVKNLELPEWQNGLIEIDLNDIAPGIYTLKLFSSTDVYTRKIVKY